MGLLPNVKSVCLFVCLVHIHTQWFYSHIYTNIALEVMQSGVTWQTAFHAYRRLDAQRVKYGQI